MCWAADCAVWAGRASQCLYLASHHQAATEKGASAAADAAAPGLRVGGVSFISCFTDIISSSC